MHINRTCLALLSILFDCLLIFAAADQFVDLEAFWWGGAWAYVTVVMQSTWKASVLTTTYIIQGQYERIGVGEEGEESSLFGLPFHFLLYPGFVSVLRARRWGRRGSGEFCEWVVAVGGGEGKGRTEWVRVLGCEGESGWNRWDGEGKGGRIDGGQGWHSWRSARLTPPHRPLNSFRPTNSYCLQAFISTPYRPPPLHTLLTPPPLYLSVFVACVL